MAKLKIKGHEFNAFLARDSFNRRAVQFKNNIIKSLGKIGISDDDIEIDLEGSAIKKAPASCLWYIEGCRLYYSYNGADKFVENIYVVSKVIELEVLALLNERKTLQEFIADFTEDKDVDDARKKAKKILGVDEESLNMDMINSNYKQLAKEHHPDMPNGNMEKFKEINNAHKILKRELE